jgi:hypothetical protein
MSFSLSTFVLPYSICLLTFLLSVCVSYVCRCQRCANHWGIWAVVENERVDWEATPRPHCADILANQLLQGRPMRRRHLSRSWGLWSTRNLPRGEDELRNRPRRSKTCTLLVILFFSTSAIVAVTKLHASRPLKDLKKKTSPTPQHEAVSQQYSVASFPTLRVLSCLHSPRLSRSFWNVVRFCCDPEAFIWWWLLHDILYCRAGLPNGIFNSVFPNKILYAFLISPMRATCPTHLIRLDSSS